DSPFWRALEGDTENLLGQAQLLGIPRSHETKQGMNRGEPNVSGSHTVLPFLLEVGEKRQDPGWLQILQIEFLCGPLAARREKPKKQYDAVAVTMDGVRASSANARQVIGEVVTHDGAQQSGMLLLHACPPFRLGAGTTSSP